MGCGQEAVLLPLDLWGDIQGPEGSLRLKWEAGEGPEVATGPGDCGESSERRARTELWALPIDCAGVSLCLFSCCPFHFRTPA